MAGFDDETAHDFGGNDSIQQPVSVFGPLSYGDIRAALAVRERQAVEAALKILPAARAEARRSTSEEARTQISERAYDLIVEFETGGRAHYESPHGINKRPCWPGGDSGVTIGCGYDLGYNTRADFETAWGSLAPQEFSALLGALVKKGRAAKNFLPRVKHIVIEWGVALAVFDAVDLPTEKSTTLAYLPTAAEIHGHCFGALVSLVFNRGPSFKLQGDRYREMRAIYALMNARQYDGIPAQIRNMKRLWVGQGLGGLLRRRDAEAALFQDGLDAMRIANQTAATRQRLAVIATGNEVAKLAPGVAPEGDPDLSWLESLTQDQLDHALYGPEPDDGSSQLQYERKQFERAVHYGKPDVHWVSNDRNHPDYVHLPPDAKGASFRFNAADLETLIKHNRFAPPAASHGKLIFALRGAKLNGSGHAQENSVEISLTDVRPDHWTPRCVIGIYDRQTQKLWAYTASTVCNAGAVVSCYNHYNFDTEKKGNILLTGCYQMCVGTHVGSVTVPGVFRLGTGPDAGTASKHTVLRTANDVTLGTMDIWDPCVPKDNLHPAFGNDSFSSLGCLTVRGTYNSGHQGEWKKLRAAAGLRNSQDSMGTRYDMVLVTGLDAATASLMRERQITEEAVIDEALGCLRQGSQGPLVQKLQTKLGMAGAAGVFDWKTASVLADYQMSKLGWATGTYFREMDVHIGFEIFGPAATS